MSDRFFCVADVEERGGDSTIEVMSLMNEMSEEECAWEFIFSFTYPSLLTFVWTVATSEI